MMEQNSTIHAYLNITIEQGYRQKINSLTKFTISKISDISYVKNSKSRNDYIFFQNNYNI